MSLPKSFKIEGIKVNIKEKDLDGDDHGVFHSKTLTITINPLYSLIIQKRTLIHEMTHAIIYIRTQYIIDEIQKLNDQTLAEELIAEYIGEQVFMVLYHNPALRRWLFEKG